MYIPSRRLDSDDMEDIYLKIKFSIPFNCSIDNTVRMYDLLEPQHQHTVPNYWTVG